MLERLDAVMCIILSYLYANELLEMRRINHSLRHMLRAERHWQQIAFIQYWNLYKIHPRTRTRLFSCHPGQIDSQSVMDAQIQCAHLCLGLSTSCTHFTRLFSKHSVNHHLTHLLLTDTIAAQLYFNAEQVVSILPALQSLCLRFEMMLMGNLDFMNPFVINNFATSLVQLELHKCKSIKFSGFVNVTCLKLTQVRECDFSEFNHLIQLYFMDDNTASYNIYPREQIQQLILTGGVGQAWGRQPELVYDFPNLLSIEVLDISIEREPLYFNLNDILQFNLKVERVILHLKYYFQIMYALMKRTPLLHRVKHLIWKHVYYDTSIERHELTAFAQQKLRNHLPTCNQSFSMS